MTKKRPKLLIAESTDFSPAALELLQTVCNVETADLDRSGLVRRVEDCDLIWVRLRTMIDQEILDAGRRLKGIVTNTTGLNHIDLAAAERRGIRIWSLRGEHEFLKEVRATAELTLGIALALLRRIPAAHQHVLGGGWDRDQFRGRELNQRRVGLIGYGRLGKQVASCFRAFGSQVSICDPNLSGRRDCDGFPVIDLQELLETSELVSVHASHQPGQAPLLRSAEFRRMRRGSYFVNTARGELVDEAALADAIETGHLAGAALDVRDREHEPTDGFARMVAIAKAGGNVILTPHCGGNTWESRAQTEIFLARKLVAAMLANDAATNCP